jgi:L,D-transpeptidase-like protein
MKRVALIAGVSLAALLMAGPTSAWALPGDVNGWSNGLHFATTPSVAEPLQKSSRRHLRGGDRASRKSEPADKAPPIPAGPLAIIVSIDKQRATLYADGQPIASTAVSTGTREHPTPMGVFSVIQKDKHHVSNLYNASMPYMQRITWSGSALHEGPLPGYPASHGCVRLTSSFAQMLWRTTKMGARVIVTHPDVTPVEFDSPRLFVPKPKLVEAAPPIVPAALIVPTVVPVVGTVPAAEPAPAAVTTVAEPALTSGIAKIRTADASNTTAVLSVIGGASKSVATSVVTEPTPNNPSAEQPTKLSETEGSGGSPKPSETQTEAMQAPPAEEKPAEAAVAETKPVVEDKPVAEVKPAEAKTVEPKAVAIPATEAKLPMIAAPAPIVVDERPKAMPAAVMQEANGRPISVFVSLKEGKLYVRQGWKPLFEGPVSFENPTQPIGTHVYTAMGVKAGGPELRWTVISIPSGYHRHVAELRPERGRKSHGEHPVKIAEIEPAVPPTPSAALDRIIMPPELIERISAMITPGSSLIVSDNRLSDETGEYTDFIVTTR